MLRGKGGAICVRNYQCDFFIITLYMPTNPKSERERESITHILHFVETILAQAPARTVPILLERAAASGPMWVSFLGTVSLLPAVVF